MASQRKVALVTGAASGIGYATARRLAASGWTTALVDRDDEGVKEAKTSLLAAGWEVSAQVLDVTDEKAVYQTVGEIAALGDLRGVVNCAGIVADLPLEKTTLDMFRVVLETNVLGAFLVARAAVPHLRGAGGGSIVNVSSIAAMRGISGRTAYAASKAALISMTRVWATELAPDRIRVNAVAPGPVETAMAKSAHSPATREALLANVPLRRYAEPDEIAASICFLLEDEASSYVTGHVLVVDGGYMGGGVSWQRSDD